VVGGTASQATNPTQRFYSVTRSGGATSTPTMRVMGAKGQTLAVEHCDYLQLYADTSTGNSGPDCSIAYSQFFLTRCTRLEVTNNPSTPNSSVQWINENRFYLSRTSRLDISGTYNHNHNQFYAGCFEGSSTINLSVGSSNIFWGVRFEAGATVTFGATTWANKVICTWEPNQKSQWEDFVLGVTVSDSGDGNYVGYLANAFMRKLPVLTVNANTCRVFSDVNGATTYARSPNITSLRNVDLQAYGPEQFHRQNFRLIYDSPLIPVVPGEALSFSADATLFRPRIRFYDSSRTLITDATAIATYWRGTGGFTWDSGANYLVVKSNVSTALIVIRNSAVAFVKFDIASGGGATNVPFRRLSMQKVTFGLPAGEHSESLAHVPQAPAVSASPTIGFAPEVGFKVSNTAGGWFTATRALDTTLSAASAGGTTTVTLTSVTGVTSGDVLGVELDTGAWHWTTVSGAPAGNTVTLAAALPAAAASGRRAVSNGWTAS
jgi:hypothetical protein